MEDLKSTLDLNIKKRRKKNEKERKKTTMWMRVRQIRKTNLQHGACKYGPVVPDEKVVTVYDPQGMTEPLE